MRQAGGYSEREQLEQIYENMEYQLYIQLIDQMSMDDLHARIAKIEEANRRRQETRSEAAPTAKPAIGDIQPR